MDMPHHGQLSDSPWPTQRPPYSPTLINLNQNYNMTANSLTEALLILSSMYLSLVQPDSLPINVTMHTVFTEQFTFTKVRDGKDTIYDKPNQKTQLKAHLNAVASKYYLRWPITPKTMLTFVCDELFPKNSITVFFVDNQYGKLAKFEEYDANYLRKTYESLGLPVISYDTHTWESSKRPLTLELAPTISQMMEAFFAFMKQFGWTDFSFLCALPSGCDSSFESIRHKVDESNRKYNISIYGVEVFSYRLLSYVNVTDYIDVDLIRNKLTYELDRDTRIILVHGDTKNVLTIMEVAKELEITGEDYVWIFTLTAMEQASMDTKVNGIYPIGSFGFDSKPDDMVQLYKGAQNMWFSALKLMAAARELENIDFQTPFSCDKQNQSSNNNSSILFWKYGEILYRYLLKTKFLDQVGFDEKGFLKFNNFWIKNVQPMKGSEVKGLPPGSTTVKTRRSFPNIQPKRLPTETLGKKPEEYDTDLTNEDLVDTQADQNSIEETAAINSTKYQLLKSSRKYSNKNENFKAKHLERNEVLRKHSNRGRLVRRQRNDRDFVRRGLNAIQTIATWNGHNLSVSGIVWPGGSSMPPRGKPEKYVLKVVTWAEDPHVIYTEKKNDTQRGVRECESNALPCTIYIRDSQLRRLGNQTRDVCCTGLSIDLLQKLSVMLSFDVQLTEVADGSYGSPINNNESDWSGIVGMLIHKKADMAIGALSVTPERSNAVDFSIPFLQTGISIIVAIREGAISPTAFLEPYDYPSWSLILLFSVHATGASIFIFEWLSPYGLNQGKTSLRVHKFSLFRSFWLIWAMLFGASVSTDQPRGCASRFLANIWALFAVVFCASYTANLAAFMITKDDFYDLSGIQDWRLKNPHHRQPPFKYATIANSSTDLNIAKNYKAIHSYMKNYAQTSVKDAIRALKNQEIQAFIYDSTTLEYEFGKDVGCKLKTVGKRIAETGYGVAFPKQSLWVKKVDKALLKLQEDGEIERLQKFWLAGACHKKKERGVSSHTLGILNFTSAFILLGGGVILSVILLIVEHMYFRFGRKSLKKWDKCGCCSLVSLSMGQSLTFEQSVIEAIDFHKHHKCKDPLCETQLWKVKHELDIALLKISQLRRLLAHSTSLEAARDQAALNKPDPQVSKQANSNTRNRRRQQKIDTLPGNGDKRSSRPLLDNRGDTDEEEAFLKLSEHSKMLTKQTSSPNTDIPLQVLQPTQVHNKTQNVAIETKRQPSGKKHQGDKTHKVTDLELHPPPPTFDEAVLGYNDLPDPNFSPLPPPPPDVPESYSPSSEDRRYEPFILDSPESPSSSFSQVSDHNRLPSPGDLSKLSDEGHSSQASPSKDSNYTSSPDMKYSQEDRRPMSPMYSNIAAVPQLVEVPNRTSVLSKKTDNSQALSKEDDNDVRARRLTPADGNVYVNVDEIIGKETSF